MKFEARIHGIDPDKNNESAKEAQDVTNAHIDNSNVYEYGDRDAFSAMTEEQKEESTNAQLAMLMGLPV